MATVQPIRGFVGQSMSGRRPRGVIPNRVIDVPGTIFGDVSGSVTLTEPATALIFLLGGCGSGSAQIGGSPGAGAGGAALYRRVLLGAGAVLFYTAGRGGAAQPTNPGANGLAGGDTTLTLPDGTVLIAGGGAGGLASTRSAGGVATGGDVNRSGGAGGGSGLGAGAFGAAGEDGGSLGRAPPNGSTAGGGGAAGLESIIQAGGFVYGTGGDSNNASSGASMAGTPGRVLIIFVQTRS